MIVGNNIVILYVLYVKRVRIVGEVSAVIGILRHSSALCRLLCYRGGVIEYLYSQLDCTLKKFKDLTKKKKSMVG